MKRQQLHPTPQVTLAHWSLSIGGAVSVPLIWSWDDIAEIPGREFHCVHLCSAFSQRPTERRWTGFPLAVLLSQVSPQNGVSDYAKLIGYDGYVTVLPTIRLNDAWIATGTDQGSLSPDDGFPARLLVPGLAGYKMPKWLHRIELGASPQDGFWEQHGWSPAGELGASAWVDYPAHPYRLDAPVTVTGTAYAGNHPVEHVWVRINHGDWTPAEFTQPSTHQLAHWQVTWNAPAPGIYPLNVQAVAAGISPQPMPETLQSGSLFRRQNPAETYLEVLP
ncbi:molybdopterin-dependent oxidoreductase [Geitlerinema splendidum]|jgi:hypothetical protein|nr:molybdopterin-dependent oxidoreductase [Geitlerinema splendidum]